MAFDPETPNQEQPKSGSAPAKPVPGAEILVAIPVLNEIEHIEACLASLQAGDERLEEVVFVVADGGSTDGTRAVLDELSTRFDNFHWIDNPGRLQSAGVNAVANQFGAGRRILVRCDAHSIYPPAYVTDVADALAGREVASLVVPMDATGEGCFQKANAWVVDTPLGSGGSAHRGGTASGYVDHGHHAGFDLGMFQKLSGYDPTFSHNEDAEYDARVVAAGGKIYLDAGIRLQYKPRATPSSLARQYFNYGKGRVRTLLKHRIRPKLRQLFPVLNLAGFVGAFLIAPLIPLALACPAFYVGVLLLAALWLAVRHRSACALLAAPAAAIMHMSWAVGFLVQLVRSAGRG